MQVGPGREWRDRGAVALAAALIITAVAVPMSAYVVDLGIQRVARQDAQTIADAVATDLSRQLGTASPPTAADATVAAARTSRAAGAVPSMSVVLGYIGPTASFRSDHSLGCGANPYNAYFAAVPSGQSANAVLVVARASVQRSFARVFGAGPGSVCRSAIGRSSPAGTCYAVSAFGVGVDTANSVLGPLLGTNSVSTQLLDSSGIADTSVALAGVAAQLGFGSTQALIDSTVTMGQFISAASTVLTNAGNSGSVSKLGSFQQSMGAGANIAMNLGRLVSLGTGNGNAADAQVNLGMLFRGALLIASGTNAIAMNGLNLNVPGLGQFNGSGTVIQPPKQGCNGAPATAAQVTFNLDQGTHNSLTQGLASVTNLHVAISLANATVVNDPSAACSPNSMTLLLSNQTLVNIRITGSLSVLGLGVAQLDTGPPLTVSNGSVVLSLPLNYSQPVTTSSDMTGVDLSRVSGSVLGLISLSNLGTLLAPLTTSLTQLLSRPLFESLGISVAGANLWAVAPTTCLTPRLAM